MIPFLLASSIIAELSAVSAVAFSIRFPGRRIWPPDQLSSWKPWLMGFLFFYPAVGIGILGMSEWGSLAPPGWLRIGSGIPPFLGGAVIFLWAAAVLGFGPMFGGGRSLAVAGPFPNSRNPQYVGCLCMLIGWSLLSASPSAAAASLFAVPPLLLVPFAEEPWLREQHGRIYEDYMRQVPRFI
jgi:protein-S-isoprenylcysteine O-methyltransferase Ste14